MGLIPRKLLNRKSYSGGSYVKGKWTEGTAVIDQIRASVQPISLSDMESLPEGRRERESYYLFTNNVLKLVFDSNDTPDEVEVNPGEWFEIFNQKPWKNNIISHNVYIVQKVTSK